MRTLTVAGLLLILANHPANSVPSAEERRRMVREFEAENRAERDAVEKAELEKESPEQQGLEPLREELNQARSEFLREKSPEHRSGAERATLRFVEPLLRLRRFDEAIAQIELTVKLIGRRSALLESIVSIRLEQSAIALHRGEFSTAVQVLLEAQAVAKRGNLRETLQAVDRGLRDLNYEWAQDYFLKGDPRRARDKAQDALAGGIEPQPVYAFLARISYLSNDYSQAFEELEAALSGPYRERPDYLRLADILVWESYLERKYRRISLDGLLLSKPSGLVVNDRALEAAFVTARQEASRVFGVDIPMRVPVSIYPRSDFFPHCHSPLWQAAVSIEGKLRIRSDILKGSRNDLDAVALYGYGLWVADILSGGNDPAWVREGFAHQLALPTGPPNSALGTLKRLASQERVPSFRDLVAPFNIHEDIREAAQAMAQAQTGIQFIIEKKGLLAVPSLLSEFRSAPPPEDAMRKILGYDYASFLSAWSQHMQSGFATKPFSDLSALRSLGVVSPMGSYWER